LARQLFYICTGDDLAFKYSLKSTVEAANVAFLAKNMPGCWPKEDKIRLVPGVDFEIHRWCKEEILSWYHDYIDHDSETDLENEDSEEEIYDYDSEDYSSVEKE
jgi:hypothetical protein